MAHPQHGALDSILGVVSANASWNEDITIEVNGVPATGYSNDTWHFTFRKCDAVALTLSTTSSGGLTYTETSTQSLLNIGATPEMISGLCGDYVADISSKTTTEDIIHWAHGMVTFQNNPEPW